MDGGRLGHEAAFAQAHLPGPGEQPPLPLLLCGALLLGGLSGEEPGAVVEEAGVVGRLVHVILRGGR